MYAGNKLANRSDVISRMASERYLIGDQESGVTVYFTLTAVGKVVPQVEVLAMRHVSSSDVPNRYKCISEDTDI